MLWLPGMRFSLALIHGIILKRGGDNAKQHDARTPKQVAFFLRSVQTYIRWIVSQIRDGLSAVYCVSRLSTST